MKTPLQLRQQTFYLGGILRKNFRSLCPAEKIQKINQYYLTQLRHQKTRRQTFSNHPIYIVHTVLICHINSV